MTDVVERAKAVLAGVTEGPWSAIPGDRYYFGSATNVWTEHGRGRLIAGDLHKPNAEFIAQARTLVPDWWPRLNDCGKASNACGTWCMSTPLAV
ncbi:hypothetical protein BN970_03331 [Mycolicibacterium conceptionense]|uniref:Uncharacterized protein n=1 Tax=Mycolicibacterium conceptionense TaxID=451644 RepID=A0A0U1DG96_9MYCO|nr:hypothetical protein BN970_03331 [Mycolicibacterium conceptionense]